MNNQFNYSNNNNFVPIQQQNSQQPQQQQQAPQMQFQQQQQNPFQFQQQQLPPQMQFQQQQQQNPFISQQQQQPPQMQFLQQQQCPFSFQQSLSSLTPSRSNVIYNDDEPLKEKSKSVIELTDEQKQQIKQISNKVHLQIQTQYSKIQKSNNSQKLAGMITVKSDELYEMKNEETNINRPGIDIIFLLDRSGSMGGEKIALLRETLLYVLTILNEEDRISLVPFDHEAQRLTPLQRMTEANKDKLTKHIKSLQSQGGTDFFHPFDCALNMIKNRKYKNQLTSIFVLTDGQASRNYETLFKNNDIEDQFTIQTFGIGADHDPSLMRDMAQLKQGNFYYIENMTIADECFVDALGGIVSIVAKNIKIKLNFEPLINNQKASVKEAYSIFWKKNQNNEYEVLLNNLISGSSKDFVFLMDIPPLQDCNSEMIKIVEATMEFTNIDETDTFTKSTELSLTLTDNSNLEQFLNKDVFINFERISVAELMKKAADLAGMGENYQAQKELQKKIDELKKVSFVKDNQILQGLIKDLEEAHKRCEKQNFAVDGNIWLQQRNYMHMQQQGADFLMPQQQNMYSNCMQQQMQMKCKSRKA